MNSNYDECKTFCVTFCEVCLAQDRRLSELGEFTELFIRLCDISNVHEQMMICWECKAILKKVKKFQLRALRAQITLSYEFPPASSLSTITSITLEDDKYVYLIDKLLTQEENDDKSGLNEEKDNHSDLHEEKDIKFDLHEEEGNKTDLHEEKDNRSDLYVEIDNKANLHEENVNKSDLHEEQDDISDSHEEQDALLEAVLKKEDEGIEDTYENMESGDNEMDNDAFSLIDDMPLSEQKYSVVKLDIKDHNLKEKKLQKMKQQQYRDDVQIEDKSRNQIEDKSGNKDNDSKALSTSLNVKRGNSKAAKILRLRSNDPARHSYKNIGSKRRKIKVKKVKINPKEVTQWREREKASEYFSDAKFCKLKCNSCIIGFKNEEALKKHIRMNHSKKYRNTCKICLRTMPDTQLHAHEAVHNEVYMCECGYQSYSMSHIYWHMTRDHCRKVQCLECGSLFLTLKSYYVHFKELHSDSGYKCDSCGERFSTKAAIREHIVKAHPIGSECKICNRKFKSHSTYKNHMVTQHTVCPSEATYCVVCDKHFENREKYTLHLYHAVVHKGERKQRPQKTYPCSHCDKVFKKSSSRKNHIDLIHIGKTKHYCPKCDKYYCTSFRLRVHNERKHLGIPPPKNKKCSICGRAFSNNIILTHHMRTHTGERPHECELCDSKFAQKIALKLHVKHIHLNVKRKATNK